MRRLLLLLGVAVAGCGEGSTPPDVAVARTEIDGIIKAYHKHLSAGEVDKAMEFAAPDFSIVSNWDNPVHGKEASVELLNKFVEIYKEKDILGKRDARYADIRIDINGQVAVAQYSVSFLEPKGVVFNEAYQQVFRREGGKWVMWKEARTARTK
jgi:hypothetical protein